MNIAPYYNALSVVVFDDDDNDEVEAASFRYADTTPMHNTYDVTNMLCMSFLRLCETPVIIWTEYSRMLYDGHDLAFSICPFLLPRRP